MTLWEGKRTQSPRSWDLRSKWAGQMPASTLTNCVALLWYWASHLPWVNFIFLKIRKLSTFLILMSVIKHPSWAWHREDHHWMVAKFLPNPLSGYLLFSPQSPSPSYMQQTLIKPRWCRPCRGHGDEDGRAPVLRGHSVVGKEIADSKMAI